MKTINKFKKPYGLKQVISCLLWSILMGLFLSLSAPISGQVPLSCNYKSGNFSMTLEGHTTGIGFSSRLVLTDIQGVIQYVTPVNSTNFQNVLSGNYLAYGITYENAVYTPSLKVGANINLVSKCYKTVVVPTIICDCNNDTGNLLISSQNPTTGRSVSYALTDGKGTILLIKTEPIFNGNSDGVYNIVPVTYKEGTYPENFQIGRNISDVSGAMVNIQKSSGFVVCLTQKPRLFITKSAPTMANLGETFLYVLNIKNIGTAPTNGTIVITDTLSQGLTFQTFGTNPNWSCQSNIVIVNNSARTLITCQTNNVLVAEELSTISFNVKAQRTGIFENVAHLEGGGITTPICSNKVKTEVKDSAECKEICVPFTVRKTKKK